MREADIGQDALIQAGGVVGTQTRHVRARKRNVGQCLMLHARGIFERSAARPSRLGDDADVLARVAFDEGELRSEDPAGVTAKFHDVSHRHVRRRVTQRATQRRQPVPRNCDQHRLRPVQTLGDEPHQPIDVFALRVIQERRMVEARKSGVCGQCHVDGLVPRQCFAAVSPR